MRKNSLPKRALSALLAAALVVTLMPAGALTFAQEASAAAAQEASSSASSVDEAKDALDDGAAAVGTKTKELASTDASEVGTEQPALNDAFEGAPTQLPDDAGQEDLPGTSSADAELVELTAPSELVVDGSVHSISVPATVHAVSPVYFWQFPNAQAIVVEEGNETFASYEGILYTADMKTLVAAPLGIGAEVKLAPSCESIAAGAFRGVGGIERIHVSSIVSSIFVSAGDTSEDATGYADADLASAELSAFSVQTAREAIVDIDVDPADAIESAFAWSAAGFQDVRMPEAPADDDAAVEGSAPEDDASDGADAAGEIDGTQPDGADADGNGADPDADSATADADAASDADAAPSEPPVAPITPVRVLDAETPLKDIRPASDPRPQMVTGEYSIADATEGNTSERVVTSNDILSYEAPIEMEQNPDTIGFEANSGSSSDVVADTAIIEGDTIPDEKTASAPDESDAESEEPRFPTGERDAAAGPADEADAEAQRPEGAAPANEEENSEDQEETKSATIMPTAGSLRLFSDIATYSYDVVPSNPDHDIPRFPNDLLDPVNRPDSDRVIIHDSNEKMPEKLTTTLKANGGQIYAFYINGNPITDKGGISWKWIDRIQGSQTAMMDTYEEFDHRGGGAVGVNTNGNGYFHTTRKSSKYNNNDDTPGFALYGTEYLYRYNIQCTRTGYTMTGWTKNKAGGTLYEGPSSDTDGMTLYANWAPKKYTITYYDFYEGSGTSVDDYKNYYTNRGQTPATAIATFDATVPTLTPPTRGGYKFNGFFTEPGGQGTRYYDADGNPLVTCTTNDNISLYASWVQTSFPLTFYDFYEGDGSSTTDYDQYYEHNATFRPWTATATTGQLVPTIGVPGWAGRQFLGYFTEPGGKGAQYYDASGMPLVTYAGTAPEGTKLYAAWSYITYTLTFDPNGGTLVDANGSPTTGKLTKNYTIASRTDFYDNPTREGYTFAGWMIVGLETSITVVYSDGREVPYVEGAPVSFTSFNAGVRGSATLTALWRSTITVSDIAPPSMAYTTSHHLYYYPGYGYSTTAYGGFDIYLNRGSFVTSANFATISLASTPADIGGFTFKGYYSQPRTDFYTEGAGGGEQRLTTDGRLPAFIGAEGNATWYAQWEAIGYTVTLDPAGGAFDDGSTAAKAMGYKRAADVPLVGASQGTLHTGYTPARDGWYFVGWHATSCPATVTSSRAASGKPHSNMYLASSDYGDITFTAVWRAAIALNKNAPQRPKATTVTFGTSSIYYYTGYGFSFGKYFTGATAFETADAFYQKGDAMFAATATFAPPVCDDEGWIYGGFVDDGNCGTAIPISETGILAAESVEGNTSWSASWIPRTYYATLNASPGTQGGATRVAFLYGDSKLRDYESFLRLPVPTFEGWTFAGYYLGERRYYEGGVAGSAAEGCLVAIGYAGVPLLGDCTLTAKWVRDITVNANGGAAAASRTIQVTYGEQLPASAAAVLPTTPTAAPRGVTWTFAGLYGANTEAATRYYDGSGTRQYSTIIRSTTPSTIYARWQRTVKVEPNGGTGAASISITKGITTRPTVDASAFAWEGYTLAGFYQNADPDKRGTKYFEADGSPTNSCYDTSVPATVYAQWDAAESIIAFDANGGTGGPADITGVTARAVPDRTMPVAQPVLPNFYFDGWFSAREGGEKVEQLPAAFPAGGITYYAHWTAKPSSAITYKAEEGGAIQLSSAAEKVASFTQEGVLPDTGSAMEVSAVPDMGYAFAGWFADDGTLVSSQQSGWAPTRPAKGWPASTTYHARFEQAGSQIAYRCAVCGTELARTDVPACEHIHSIAALPAGFQLSDVAVGPLTIGGPVMPPYYRFTGWSGTGLAGSANETITLDADHLGDKVFTAHVEATPFTLTLDAAGGTWGSLASLGSYTVNGQRAMRTYRVDDSSFQLPVPQRDGYVFDHWERDGQPVSGTFAPSSSNYGDITLTAVWEAASVRAYRIEYILDDAQGPDAGWIEPGDAVNNYGEDDDVMLPIPQRVGYDFLGWTEESALPPEQLVLHGNTPQMMAFIAMGHTGDRVFRAHWLAHEYTIEYDLDGGTWEDLQTSSSQTCIYDKDVTIASAPVRASYLFEGWVREGASGAAARLDAGQVLPRANLIAKTGSTAADDGTPTDTGTVVLRAVWTPVLSFDVGVAATGVHLGLTLDANAANPFGTNKPENWGEATIQNRTDAALKVKTVSPNPAADYAQLEANALTVFRDQDSLDQVSFKVKPAEGPLVLLTIPEFKLADSTGSPWNLADTGNLNYPIGWMMKKAGDADGGDTITLNYQLDMGNLTPAEVDFSTTTSLQVASVRFSVALVGEESEA